jgi:WD40 repeat protein
VPANPFLALRPFKREDAPRFFGRDGDLVLVKSRLVSARTTLLFAGSGVGKSSFLNAKLAPDVESQWQIVAHRSWATRPPLEAVQLSIAANAPHATGIEGLPLCDQVERLIASAAGARGCLLILDQFEEVFQQWRDSRSLDEFAREVARLAHAKALQARVLISMREEFLGELSIFDNLIPDLFNNCYRLKNATRAEAEDIISRTALTENVETGPGIEPLVDDLARAASDAVRETPPERSVNSRLPMPFLQIVCYRLWQQQMIGLDGSLRPGRFLEAAPSPVRIELEHYGREKLASLSESEQDLASAAFGLLVTRSGAKMAYPLDVLAEQARVDEAPLLEVLKKLAAEDVRILREISAGPGRTPWFELYHDLYSRFLVAWTRDRDTKRENRKRWQLVQSAAAVVIVTVSIVAGFMLYRADRQERRVRLEASRQLAARLLQLAADRRASDGVVTTESIRFAVESLVRDPTEAAREFLRRAGAALVIETGRIPVKGVDRFAISPDGQVLCEASANGIRLSRLPRRDLVGLAPRSALITDVVFSPDGASLAAAGYDGKVEILSTKDAKTIRSIEVVKDGSVTAVTYSRNGALLAAAVDAKRRFFANVYSSSDGGSPLATVNHRGRVSVVALSATGRYLLTGSDDKTVRVRDLESGQEQTFYHPDKVLAGVFRPDGLMFASSSADGTTDATSLPGGAQVRFSGPSKSVASALAFSPKNRFLATGQGTLWDLSNEQGQPLGRATGLIALGFTPDERLLAVANNEGALLIGTRPLAELIRISDGERVDKMLFGPQGDWMGIKVRDTLRLFRVASSDSSDLKNDAALESFACRLTDAESGKVAEFLGKESPLACQRRSR